MSSIALRQQEICRLIEGLQLFFCRRKKGQRTFLGCLYKMEIGGTAPKTCTEMQMSISLCLGLRCLCKGISPSFGSDKVPILVAACQVRVPHLGHIGML